jgi:kinesin family protein 5
VVDSTSISNKEKEDCSFTFDKVYGQESTTEQIYNDVVAPIVKDAFNGFNGTILCYCQTTSGECGISGMSSRGEVEWLQGCSSDNYSK